MIDDNRSLESRHAEFKLALLFDASLKMATKDFDLQVMRIVAFSRDWKTKRTFGRRLRGFAQIHQVVAGECSDFDEYCLNLTGLRRRNIVIRATDRRKIFTPGKGKLLE